MKHLHDIEVFWEHFELSVQDYETGESFDFQINRWRDDRKELKKYLRTFKGFSLGFNSFAYDMVVLAYLDQNNYFEDLTWEQFCYNAKKFSDTLINTEDELFKYKYTNHAPFKFTIVDVFLFWAKGLRQSKKISLKGLGIQLNYPVVQELPFDPDTRGLSKEQIDEIHHYCSVHDLGILKMVVEQFDGKNTVPLGNCGTIPLRAVIQSKYGINAWAKDGPKIASETLLKEYCRKTNSNPKEVKDRRFDRGEIKFKELFSDWDLSYKNPTIQKVYEEWMNSEDSFSKEFIIFFGDNGLKISVGNGGIHSVNENEIYESDEKSQIKTSDVALSVAQLKSLKLTGISLEFNLPKHSGNIYAGRSNYSGMVKKIEIGQSAAKHPNKDEGSETKQGI